MNPTNPTNKKKSMLEALEKALGIVTQACKMVGIHRSTHYDWLNSDEEYKQAVQDLGDVALDFAESKLHKLIDSGNPAATIFYLKTKGKHRGYVERQEIAVAEKKPLSWFTDDNADVS
jgi:hypothetical protein